MPAPPDPGAAAALIAAAAGRASGMHFTLDEAQDGLQAHLGAAEPDQEA